METVSWKKLIGPFLGFAGSVWTISSSATSTIAVTVDCHDGLPLLTVEEIQEKIIFIQFDCEMAKSRLYKISSCTLPESFSLLGSGPDQLLV